MATTLASPPIGALTKDTEDNDPKVKKQQIIELNQDDVLHDALILGWHIVELRSRIQIALIEPKHFCLRLVSIWRSIFNKIGVLHLKTFPNSLTAQSLYEPPDSDALPYLYPDKPDYANVGIPDKDSAGIAVLKNFKLYDVTRRAINCLTILYVDKDESLVPDTIQEYQDILVDAILKASVDKGAGGAGSLQSEEGTIQITKEECEASLKDLPQKEKDRMKAISILTERTVKFLTAWDGYLRENYYAGGLLPDNDSELVAYEAGRAMSLLSWGITIQTVPLELEAAKSKEDLTEKFIAAWRSVFRVEAVIRLQHQISALSTSFDNAYYEKHPTVQRHDDDTILIELDPEKPCHTIGAVKQSIEYWHRTVSWIYTCHQEGKSPFRPTTESICWSRSMRLALIEQSNIWQTLMTGQQTLRAYKMESVTHKLMQDLTEEIQASLHKDFKGSLQQAKQMMSEVTEEVKDAIQVAGNVARKGLEDMFGAFKRFFWPVVIAVGCIVLFIILGLVFTSIKGVAFGASGSAGIVGMLSAILGYFNIGRTKEKQQKEIAEGQTSAQAKIDKSVTSRKEMAASAQEADSSFLNRLQSAAGDAGKEILKGFERAYTQIRIELTGLKFSASVSYPLVEFFVKTCDIKSDEAFLTQIIWSGKDRQEEIKRIMSAAFGSLAVFITPGLIGSEKKEEGEEI